MKIDAYYMFDTAKDAPFQVLLENPDDPTDLPVAAGCFLTESAELRKAWPEMPPSEVLVCEQCEKAGPIPELAIESGATYSRPTPLHLACFDDYFADSGQLVSTALVNFKEA